MDKININLKQIRENQRLTQTEFSKILGVSRSTIVKIEGGEVQLSKKMIEKLRFSFPFEFDKTDSNIKFKSMNIDDLSEIQRYYWDIYIKLGETARKLKTLCLAIKYIDNHYFDTEKVNELKKIENAIYIISKVVFYHGFISEDNSVEISQTISNLNKITELYFSELSNKLNKQINNFEDLLLSDLSDIKSDFDIPF